MALIKERTKWILFLAAVDEPDDRHIADLSHGVFCLETAGIKPADIYIYIDGKNRVNIDKLISIGTSNKYNIQKTDDFFKDCQTNTHENMVMFITGHGGMNGLDCNPPITPYKLLERLKTTPSLNLAVIYLGQCFAGVFNYLPVAKRRAGGDYDAEVIFIGATSLHESVSTSTTENINGIDYPWVANQFLLHVFKWLSTPHDIDGDGRNTVIDSYKYAGISSNMRNRVMKISSFVDSVTIHEKWNAAKLEHEADLSNPNKLITFRALDQQYYSTLNLNYIHQECWILNSVPAQKIEF